jgi:50S ribosomal protein L16 3-hydroxylase
MSPTGFLESWLEPLDVETFRDEFFGRRSLYREGSPARLGPLASLRKWDAIDILTAQKGDVLAWFMTTDGRHMTAEVAPIAAAKLYQGGTTMYVKEPPELAPMRKSLARSLRLPEDNLQCNLFCNQPDAKTRAHFDPVDTLTVQITGRKRWRIAPNRHAPDPTLAWATLDRTMRAELRLYARGPMPDRMPEGEVEEYLLEPGAVLYVPRGYWHETESDEPSISLHVHNIPTPWVDAVLVALRGKLLRDPAFRASALTLWDPSRRAADEATLSRLLATLVRAAHDLAPDDVLPTPAPRAGAPGTEGRYARRALAAFLVEPPKVGEDAIFVTFSAAEGGTERRSTVEMSESYVRACQLFEGPCSPTLSAREIAARVSGLELDEAVGLINVLLDVGFLRPAC